MKKETLAQMTADIQEKYPDVGIQSIEVDESSGRSTFIVEPSKKSLAFLENGGAVVPHVFRDRASVITRDRVERTNLDLAVTKSPELLTPEETFKRAMKYYYIDPVVGTATNLLANLACKGFENDIDDPNIKQFFDTWMFDVGFSEILEWIFLDFFKVGHVTTYKVAAKYEPRVSYISPAPGKKLKTKPAAKATGKVFKLHQQYEKEWEEEVSRILKLAKEQGRSEKELEFIEKSAKKNIWSKGHLPVAYTVLNPLLVTIQGNLLFDKTKVALRPPPELTELLKKPTAEQTEEEKMLIKALPADLKKVAEKGGEYPLDYRMVGQITYRKQPYERYAKPRTTRVFESVEYKKALREADLSTLDGITNYMLKITIGNDEYPVVTQAELEAVAQLFNTPSKSFDVVWNHTLQVEKIVSPEIEAILGQGKYEQVNADITTGLGISRVMLDGSSDNINAASVEYYAKALMEEINYARRQVARWIYREYQLIAEAVGFDRFPRVRWDDGILKDTILYMNTLAQLVDRRMLSYHTSLEKLGFDYPAELENMKEEFKLVEDGIFGILGSPWQQAKMATAQPTQNAPKGTPSNGRPKGQTKTKVKNTDPKKQQNLKPTNPKKSASVANDIIKYMAAKEYAAFLDGARKELNDEDYIKFIEDVTKIRLGE